MNREGDENVNKEGRYILNKQEKDILAYRIEHEYEGQRQMAEKTGYSLGIVNQSLVKLIVDGYLTQDFSPTEKALELIRQNATRRAVILAAGVGMRMVPINTQVSKGLLEIRGERLVERLIKQLNAMGIYEIYIVVGFMKEKYEYLIDQYQVQLVVNSEYLYKNNLYSLALLRDKLENAYIVPCDLWCRENPFHKFELYSWYLVSKEESMKSAVRVNRKHELVRRGKGKIGNRMIGIAYLSQPECNHVFKKLEDMLQDEMHDNDFWEEALWEKNHFVTLSKTVSEDMIYEINTYEELREIDTHSKSLSSDIIQLIADILGASSKDIKDISVLKRGMTNRSFCCSCHDKSYIMRIPGEGTEKLINRQQEYDVYNTIREHQVCDSVYYINKTNGYKLTEFIEGSHTCDPYNETEVRKCMQFLHAFHQKELKVPHTFDLWERIEYYESLWAGAPSVYVDYKTTKENVYSLRDFIDSQDKNWTLTHIDAVPDNFLIRKDGRIFLIDWEYAGMQDPHVDVAMFSIYALYDREHVDALIDAYFSEPPLKEIRLKIYCYIAVCGLIWSNWCEYKYLQGVDFGEYSLRQYRYAKEYYRIFQEERNGT